MLTQHTDFNLTNINQFLAYYQQELKNIIDLPEAISNYTEFVQRISIFYDEDLRRLVTHLLNKKVLNHCNFTIFSATSSDYKLLAQRIERTTTPDSYPYQLVAALLRLGIFNADDIVANLFSAGGMSTLYDGCSRL